VPQSHNLDGAVQWEARLRRLPGVCKAVFRELEGIGLVSAFLCEVRMMPAGNGMTFGPGCLGHLLVLYHWV
jgi:hypothetical protein